MNMDTFPTQAAIQNTACKSQLYFLRDVCQRFGDREILRIKHLELEKGKIYGLLGPNGAGKTSLMRILSFISTPSSGVVIFQGQEVQRDQAAKYRARVVWVPQTPVMFTGSVAYNVTYPMRLKRSPCKADRMEKTMALLRTVGLEHMVNAPAHRLSGGEAQRVSIARAMAAGAEVILFDEPTASVDYHSRGKIIHLIHELWHKYKISIVVTTHDKALADEICQEHISLFDGKVASRTKTDNASRILPSSIDALPASLATGQDDTIVVSCLEGSPESVQAGVAARVSGIAEAGSHVILRLSLPDERVLDLLISDRESCSLCKKLGLNSGVFFIQ